MLAYFFRICICKFTIIKFTSKEKVQSQKHKSENVIRYKLEYTFFLFGLLNIIFNWDKPLEIWNWANEQNDNFNKEPAAAMASVKIKVIMISKDFIFIELINRLRSSIVMLVLKH